MMRCDRRSGHRSGSRVRCRKELVKLMSGHHLRLAEAVEVPKRQAHGHTISGTAQMSGADGIANVMVVTN